MGYESRFSKESHTQSNETMGFEDMPLKFLQLTFHPLKILGGSSQPHPRDV